MENIIDELKQVFEFEGEISEANIEKDEKTITLKNIKIYKINSEKTIKLYQKYKIIYLNVVFNCSLDFIIYLLKNNANIKNRLELKFYKCSLTKKFRITDNIFFDEFLESGEKFTIKCDFVFKESTFYEDFLLSNINFSGIVDFSEVKFKGKLNIDSCDFINDDKHESKVNFNKSKLFERVNFSFCNFESSFDFSEIAFHAKDKKTHINLKQVKAIENINFNKYKQKFQKIKAKKTASSLEFKKCKFLNESKFNNCFFEEKTIILDCNFKDKVSFKENTFRNLTSFEKSTFEKDTDFTKSNFASYGIRNSINNLTRFTNTTFIEKADFTKVNFNSKPSFYNAKFEKEAIFNNVVFNKNAFFRDCTFLENAFFKSVEFQKRSYFNRATFHGIADISNAIFAEYANFEKTKFKSAVYFDKANFKNFINMSNCTINDIVSFYGAKLYFMPYLAGVNADKNAKFNLMYTNLKNEDNIKNIVNKYINSSIFKGDKIDMVIGVRDSFRIFKSSLISQHNLLDASLYRVNELKAKELEMDLQATKLTSSQQIERYLFKIYKYTSNHHSDFLLILNWTLALICMNYCFYYYLNTSLGFEDNFLSKYIDLLSIKLVCFIPFLLIIIFAIFYKLLIKFNCLKIINSFKIVFSMIFVFCFSVGIYNQPSIITPFIGVFSDNAKNHFLNKSIINLKDYQAIRIANRLNPTAFYLNESQAKKDLLANKDIVKEDKLILSAYDEALLKGKNADEIMARINIIYYILMILCLFSLQKTARKNSIIPS